MAFGPAWYGALKESLVLYAVPASVAIFALARWEPSAPAWAYLAVPMGVFTAWITVLFAWAVVRRPTLEQKLALLAEKHCPKCGASIGLAEVGKARRIFLDSRDEACRLDPDARINFVRHWSLDCRACGTPLQMDYQQMTVVAAGNAV